VRAERKCGENREREFSRQMSLVRVVFSFLLLFSLTLIRGGCKNPPNAVVWGENAAENVPPKSNWRPTWGNSTTPSVLIGLRKTLGK